MRKVTLIIEDTAEDGSVTRHTFRPQRRREVAELLDQSWDPRRLSVVYRAYLIEAGVSIEALEIRKNKLSSEHYPYLTDGEAAAAEEEAAASGALLLADVIRERYGSGSIQQ